MISLEFLSIFLIFMTVYFFFFFYKSNEEFSVFFIQQLLLFQEIFEKLTFLTLINLEIGTIVLYLSQLR